MDLSFLKNFGQAIGHGAKAGFGAVKSGIGKGVGGIKTGIGKLGEMGEGDDEDYSFGDDGGSSGGFNLPALLKQRSSPAPMTPGFNPNAQMPQIGSDNGIIGHDPRLRNPLPQLARSPIVSQSFGQQNIPMVGRAPEGQMDRRQDAPIPQLPGHHGEPIPYNELDAAKWDHVYGKMRREPDVQRPDGSYEMGKERGVKRSWKTVLANSVLAMNKSFNDAGGYRNPDAWKAGLAGGAVGGVGSYVAPQAGEEVNFDWAHRPEIEDRMQRQQKEEDRGLDVRRKTADLEGTQARTQATIAGMKDPQLERLKTESLIAKQNAQAEAIRTGKPQKFMQYDANTGQYIQGWKYPDGREEYGGQSGEAQLKREGYENQRGMNTDRIEGQNQRIDKQIGARKVIVGMQQGGANYRKGIGEAGQNVRSDNKIKAQYGDGGDAQNTTPYGPDIPPQGKAPAVGSVPVKRATAGDVSRYAKMKGVSPAEARKRFEAKGYWVK